MPPIATGLIGYGTAGSAFHAPLIAAEPGLTLRSIASSRHDSIARDFPDAHIAATPQALIDAHDIELVVIATPNDTHFPLAMAALKAGKHVVVDKPFALDVGQADRLIAAASAAGRVLSVFQNRRWDNDYLTVLDTIERGVLGEIVYFESHFDRYRPAIKAGWREQPAPGSGVLFDLGAHLIDQALQLFGWPEAISADVLHQREQALADDYFHLQLHYGRRRVLLHASTLAAAPGARFTVHGERGSLVKFGLDSQEAALRAGRRPGEANWGADDAAHFATLTHSDGRSERLPTLPGTYTAFYRGMVAAILDGVPAPVDPGDARDVLRLIEAARQSVDERRIVPLVQR